MSLDLQVRTNPVPEGFCFTGFGSSSWLDLIALMYVRFEGDFSLFNFGSTTPAANLRDRPWIRTNSDGTPDALYVYAMGAWLTKHPLPQDLVCMYEGSEASIDTFDGGEAGAVTTISGPFWEKVDEMDARSPMGPGTLPSTQVIAVGDDFGEEKHTQTAAEVGPHTHDVQIPNNTAPPDTVNTLDQQGDGSAFQTVTSEENTPSATPFNVVHPVHGIFFIRRTARLYRRI